MDDTVTTGAGLSPEEQAELKRLTKIMQETPDSPGAGLQQGERESEY